MKVKESAAKEERDNLSAEQQQQTKERTRYPKFSEEPRHLLSTA